MQLLYQSQVTDENLLITHCYFRNVFNTPFYIGLRTQRTDACPKCKEENRRQWKIKKVLVEKREHILEAKLFTIC